VDDIGDARIQPYLNVRERDLAARDDLFIVEGRIALSALLGSRRFDLVSVLSSQPKAHRIAALLADAGRSPPLYAAAQPVMDAIAGFHVHRGVLALARRRPGQPASDLIAPPARPSLLLVLVGLSNHDNVGACFRNASAFGVDGVILDPTCCDPLYRKSIRVSSGAALLVPFARCADPATMISQLQSAGYAVWSLSPGAAESLFDTPAPERLALVVGAEGPGLPACIISAGRGVRIPMNGDLDSLNVATAAAIALSYAYQARRTPAPRR
jgi:tRNA G18 (ribose-2'-O)-methylase SpoU